MDEGLFGKPGIGHDPVGDRSQDSRALHDGQSVSISQAMLSLLCSDTRVLLNSRTSNRFSNCWRYRNSLYLPFRASCRKLIRPLMERSEERRVGKECVSTCRSRGSPY